MKKWIFVLMATSLVLAGCRNGEKANGNGFRVGVVVSEGGLNDQSFNASAWKGAQQAQKELGVQIQAAQSMEGPSVYTRNLRSFAQQKYDLVFAVGYPFIDAVNQVVPEFKDVKFVLIDADAPKANNAISLKFKEEDGSFLCGALAAGMSKTGRIGFVGGMHGPLITKFEDGYRAGAKIVNPNITVMSQYTESWVDTAKGKEMALLQYANGADIIFHAAGRAGIGVISAAKDQPAGRYAIGVDSDQDSLAPGKVLTSMVKRVDLAVYDTIKDAKSGRVAPGVRVYGLKEGGVGLSEMKYTKDEVPASVMKRVDELRAKVIAGQIKVPTTNAELNAFYAKNNIKP